MGISYQTMRGWRWGVLAFSLGAVTMLGVWLQSASGSAQQESILREVALGAESTAVVQSPLTGTQSAIISCLDLSQSSPVSSSAAVVMPEPMDTSVAHEAVAITRFDRIMFTVNATHRTNTGVRLTLVNRVAVDLTCDVHFLQ